MNRVILLLTTVLLLFFAAVTMLEVIGIANEFPDGMWFVIAAISVFVLILLWLRIFPLLANADDDIIVISTPAESLTIAESVRRQEYVDKLTQIGNRSFFDARLDVLLIPDRLTGEGALTLISLTGLDEASDDDDLTESQQRTIVDAAVLIESAISDNPNSIISRISPFEFAVVVHPISKNQTKKIAQKIDKALSKLQLPSELNDGDFFHIGVTSFSPDSSRFELLANADLALRSAQLKGGSGWHQLADELDSPTWGMVQWRTFFETVFNKRKIQLYLQPVLDLETQELVHSEVFARLQDHQGKHIFANEFIPMAAACGVLSKIDRMVVDSLIKWYLMQPKSNQRLCINVSADSLLDEEFIDWLIQRLSVSPNLYSKFIIEFSERPTLIPEGDILRMVNKLNQVGIEVGIDHVGEQLVDLSYLEWFPISYLKIHQSIIYSISNEQHHHHELLIQSLAKFADAKNFLLMAEGIEKESQLRLLDELGISAGQGFFLGTPYKLEFEKQQ